MIYRLMVLCFLLIPSFTYAYEENCMLNLAVPTQIEAQSLEAIIMHRFYRNPDADFPDNFINLANVNLGLRYLIIPKLEVGTSYQFYRKEYTFHGAYSLFLPKQFLRTQALIQFFGAKHNADPTDGNWDHNFLYQVNFQSEPLANIFMPVMDFAYDGLNKKTGMGVGIDVAIRSNIDLLGEYYPVLGERELNSAGEEKANCFSAGIKFTTYGHHFMLTIANNYEIGMRRLMAGAEDNTIYYGFNIHRLFSF
jgi:hypothetical protein